MFTEKPSVYIPDKSQQILHIARQAEDHIRSIMILAGQIPVKINVETQTDLSPEVAQMLATHDLMVKPIEKINYYSKALVDCEFELHKATEEIRVLKEEISKLQEELSSRIVLKEEVSTPNPVTLTSVQRGRQGELRLQNLLLKTMNDNCILLDTHKIPHHADFTLIYYNINKKCYGYSLIDVKNYKDPVGGCKVTKLLKDSESCFSKYKEHPTWVAIISMESIINYKGKRGSNHVTENGIRLYFIHNLEGTGALENIRQMQTIGFMDISTSNIFNHEQNSDFSFSIKSRDKELESLIQSPGVKLN